MLILVHGGWETILAALLFWAVLFSTPIAVLVLLAWMIYRWQKRRNHRSDVQQK